LPLRCADCRGIALITGVLRRLPLFALIAGASRAKFSQHVFLNGFTIAVGELVAPDGLFPGQKSSCQGWPHSMPVSENALTLNVVCGF
jgi:hypothetical protein